MGKNDTKSEHKLAHPDALLTPFEQRVVSALESIAGSLERLSYKFAPIQAPPSVTVPRADGYPQCPNGHRMQPTDAECQTCATPVGRPAVTRTRIPG